MTIFDVYDVSPAAMFTTLSRFFLNASFISTQKFTLLQIFPLDHQPVFLGRPRLVHLSPFQSERFGAKGEVKRWQKIILTSKKTFQTFPFKSCELVSSLTAALFQTLAWVLLLAGFNWWASLLSQGGLSWCNLKPKNRVKTFFVGNRRACFSSRQRNK